eukprot:INCI8313.4.p1 GENE.INCI8313.4~~INCI8313.4.p1  ORF type:complete len:163 (+),score=17.42 INCI8313.4:25-489(+)
MSDIDRTACCTSRAHSIFSGRNLAVCVHYVRIPGRIGARSTRSGKAASFEMLLATSAGGSCSYPGEVFHIERPLLHFDREPVGVGDLTSGLFLAHLVKGERPKVALERTTAGVSAVMDTTSKLGSYELQLVAAQDEIESAKNNYVAEQLILRRT